MIGRIDVVMLTKNSDRFLGKSLASVYRNVPVNRLIVIDAFSTDRTKAVLEEFSKRYGNVKILMNKGSRGEARQRGIHEVETDWFMFVDSDVVLCKDWFGKASRHIRQDVGAIWGVDIPGDVEGKFMVKILKWMETRVFNIRGGTHDILIRHDAVKDIKIPVELHTLEDAYIKDWITSREYRVVISYEAYCRHYKTMSNLLSRENRTDTMSELKNARMVKERLVYAGIFALMWILQEARSKSRKGRFT